MNEIDAKRVRSGLGFFGFESSANNSHNPDDPKQVGWPPFTEYEPNYQIGISNSEILIGLGFKTFAYNSEEPKLSYGDLVLITPYFGNETVEGEMRGMVQTRSYNPTTGVSTIVVEVYYSDMRILTIPYTNNWRIAFQLNDGSNIVQNPDSPYLAKLSVYDGGSFANGYARFVVPHYPMTIIRNVIVDTDEEYYVTTETFFKGFVDVREDMSDIHKPWLGTEMTIRVEMEKTTTIKNWSYEQNPGNPLNPIIVITETKTVTPESRNHSHTFTSFDFDPASPDFFPASEGVHAPSAQKSPTPDFVDSVDGSYQMLRIYWEYPIDPPFYQWLPLQETRVTYNLDSTLGKRECYIESITPPSFFEPPFAP